MNIPSWVTRWVREGHVGVSSETILFTMLGVPGLLRRLDAPYDTSDVTRCIELLDLAELHGEQWRSRLVEVAAVCPAWEPLVPAWASIEAAWLGDVEAQKEAKRCASLTKRGSRRRGYREPEYPPSKCWWLVSTLRGLGDPYGRLNPHPFEERDEATS